MSVVDYLLLSSKLFPFVDNFKIDPFIPLYSDCHCLIDFVLKADFRPCDNNNATQGDKTTQAYRKWDSNKKIQFVNHVHNDRDGLIIDLINKLDDLSVREDIQQVHIDNVVQSLNDNFSSAAKEVFGKIGHRKDFYKHENSKPWFNRKCALDRKKFHKARKRYSFLKNDENRKRLRLASRDYKFTLNKAYSDYQFKAANELRKMSKYDSKSLWKILNKLNDRKNSDDTDISLQALYDHFKLLNTNMNEDDDQVPEFDYDDIPNDVDDFLNGPVTESEIKHVVSNLKNNKSSGIDEVLNEYIKSTLDDLMPVYIKLFNIIFDTGIIPECWSVGVMVAIFKNKGSKNDPEMYRGITLNSCFSKTFSALLNNRLNKYSDHIELINKSQAGFRRGFSTIDNIFVLHALITIYFSFGKKLFCTFVDFKSAFDTIWRAGLWQKLIKLFISMSLNIIDKLNYFICKCYIFHSRYIKDKVMWLTDRWTENEYNISILLLKKQ